MDRTTIIAALKAAGIENAAYDAKIILEDVAPNKIQSVVARRVAGEPLWRILGYRDFWKSRFYLSPDTLEPRPDTETLIEQALTGPVPKTILDLGTGTGCILLSLLHEYPEAKGIGVDRSPGACATAQLNAERLGLDSRAQFICGDWLESVTGKFDLIVSNPPYIPRDVIPNLDENVKNFDPILALDGGNDGLDPYKKLLPELKKHLLPGGRVLFEIGVGQVMDLQRLAEASGANLIRVTRDIGGVERVVEIGYGDN